jgi:hypothetical protein
MSYGEIIDSGVDINSVNTHNLFVNYFENPKMLKVKDIMGGLYQVFGCKVKTLLARDVRYLLATVPRSKLVGVDTKEVVSLEHLDWISFETRTLQEDLSTPMHSYRKKSIDNLITVFKKTSSEYLYNCADYGLTVTLFISKNQIRPYSDRGTLGLALESYNCVVSI